MEPTRNLTQLTGSATDYAVCLTQRERDIAVLVATGASNKEIAQQLTISTKTVKNMLTRVFLKTGTRSRTELAVQLVKYQYGNAQYSQGHATSGV